MAINPPRIPWLQTKWGEAVSCAPAPVTLLAVGILWGDPAAAAVAVAASVVVGIGVFKKIHGSPALAMTLAAAGASVSTLVGTLTGRSEVALIVAVLIWGFGAGLASSAPTDLGWVGQQCTIMLLVAGAFPAPPDQSAERMLLVMAGGTLQILCVGALGWLGGRPPRAIPLNDLTAAARKEWLNLTTAVRTFSPAARQALRLAVILAAAVAVWRWLSLPNGYWMAMTALLLIRPNLQGTTARAAGRIAGTVIGAILATLLIRVTPAACSPWGRAGLAGGSAALTLLLVPKAPAAGQSQSYPGGYAVFASCLTAYVVFLLDYAGLNLRVVVVNRVLLTVLGGAFALLMHVPIRFFSEEKEKREEPTLSSSSGKD